MRCTSAGEAEKPPASSMRWQRWPAGSCSSSALRCGGRRHAGCGMHESMHEDIMHQLGSPECSQHLWV
jgi:hypothetical protein